MKYLIMLISLFISLNAFAWGETFVDGEPGADGVSVVTTIDQEKCGPKAAVKVRHTGYAERLPGYIDEDLDKLAKNEAFKQGGNTVIMIEKYEAGRGTQSALYHIYMCN